MEMRVLGKTDIKVPSICLGTMNWGNGQCDEAEAHAQLDYAVAHGVNFIDAAEVYPIPPTLETQGLTETYIGTWLKKRGKRDDLIITSKIACIDQSAVILHRDATKGMTRASVREAVEGSLARLQTDYIDLYQVHKPDRDLNNFGVRAYDKDLGMRGVEIEETLTGLDDMVKEGKIRAIGISNESPWGMSEYLRLSREKGLERIVSIQNQYSLLNRTFELGLSEFVFREKVSLLAYSPLSMGALTGKYLKGARPAGARHVLFARNEKRYNPARAQNAIQKYVDLAKKYNIDPSTFAIAFVANRPFVTSVIVGATSVEQLKADIEGGNFTLTEEMRQEMEKVYDEYPDPVA